MKFLLGNGADINKQDGSLGWSPIHYASIYEIESILNVLIDHNVNVNPL